MAEGFDFENPIFDRDDYDDDDIDDRLPMVPDEDTQRITLNQSGHIADLRGQLRETALEGQKKQPVKTFYDEIEKRYNVVPDKLDYNQFKVSADGKTLYWVVGDKEIRISAKQGSSAFLSLGSLANEYNKAVGPGGTLAVRQFLNLPGYSSKTKLSQQGRQVLEKTKAELTKADDSLSNAVEMQDLCNSVNEVDTAVKTLETSLTDWNLELPDVSNAQTQTEGLTCRELQGLDKTLQTVRGELTNNLAKLTYIDKDIAREKQKLQEAEDEISRNDINARLKNLKDERSVRLEAANANKEALRTQINRIKETINKVLKEDSTLGERLRTLFREQGITIVSILTAIGMIVGMIVEAIIPTDGGTATPSATPSTKGGVKDCVKQQLHNLAEKAAAALPGVIGSIVPWLLSAMGKL